MPKLRDLLSEEELREIAARRHEMPTGPVDDPDNPEWTDEDFARAVRVEDLEPDHQAALLAAFPKTKIGRPRSANPKKLVTLRLAPDVLAYYQALGKGWQVRMEAVLREAVPDSRR